MIKRGTWIIVTMLFLLGATACAPSTKESSENEEPSGASDTEIQRLSVDLVLPEQVETNEKIVMKANVRFGEEPVTEADEVEFEIWEAENKADSEFIQAEHTENGAYTIEQSFEQGGTYYVQSHVTARHQHMMPKQKLVVGDPESAAKDEQEADDDGHSHGHSSLNLDFSPSEAEVGVERELTVHVMKEETALQKANLRFEIQRGEEKSPVWIDAKETEAGTYSAHHTFENAGDYPIVVHVRTDQLHEHKEFTIRVQ